MDLRVLTLVISFSYMVKASHNYLYLGRTKKGKFSWVYKFHNICSPIRYGYDEWNLPSLRAVTDMFLSNVLWKSETMSFTIFFGWILFNKASYLTIGALRNG